MLAPPRKRRVTATLRIVPEIASFVLGPYYFLNCHWRWDLFDWGIVAVAAFVLGPALAIDVAAVWHNRTEYRHELVAYEYRRDRARRRGDWH